MKAVGYRANWPVDHAEALLDVELPAPVPGARDVLVRVKAVSVNPVDTKVRKGSQPPEGQVKVLGWDAVGTVEAVGAHVSRFKAGDRVYYAGSITRPGANSELHAVDERIVAFGVGATRWQTLLVVGGAGGVGSILIQLARQLTQLRVGATASRPETRQWCLDLGAHVVIDHSRPLAAELKAAGVEGVELVASLTQTLQHYPQIIEALKPQGRLGVIDDMQGLDAMPLKSKALSLHWELMFTRPMYETPDMAEQGALLAEVAALVDTGRIRSTASTSFGTINAQNLRKAHALIESGKAHGKVVLAGF